MRKLVLAVTAATMAMPVAFEAPASAQTYSGRTWHDSRGRVRCRRPNGTVGLIVGGAGGALVGHALDGGRNHMTGTVLGAAAGALIGRHVARHSGSARYRCR